MFKIIFRNPFITKTDVKAGLQLISSAVTLNEASMKTDDKNQSASLLVAALKLMDQASHRFGFRNFKDMEQYKLKHGTLPGIKNY